MDSHVANVEVPAEFPNFNSWVSINSCYCCVRIKVLLDNLLLIQTKILLSETGRPYSKSSFIHYAIKVCYHYSYIITSVKRMAWWMRSLIGKNMALIWMLFFKCFHNLKENEIWIQTNILLFVIIIVPSVNPSNLLGIANWNFI